ncbi:MAG: DUF3105 domain-containing protein [Candidatus Blackburnbacteria bacterium]|nr:DUF3105 domain-containing protein [Candidatus Blackburnbacteria bacterium]
MDKLQKIAFPIIVALVLTGLGWFLFKSINKPLPGEAVTLLSRDHVTDISNVQYSSSPPTSGPHFSAWAKAGAYDEILSDGYLLHSLEHGYVVVSYDCTKPFSISHFPFSIVAYAHEGEEPAATLSATEAAQPLAVAGESEPFTPENAPKVVALPEAFKTDSCKVLAGQLARYLKVAKRVIVVPRLGMDTPIALTAWGRIEKLGNVDDGKIKEFVKAFENRGPEQTDE